jgi:hypothetical protein
MSDLTRNIRRPRAPAVLLVLAGALAGCQTTGSPAPSVQAAPPEPPMTHTRAAEQCWMETEKGHADKSLDQRADIVTKCIADKMKAAHTGKPDSKPDAKPDAKPKADAKPAPKS